MSDFRLAIPGLSVSVRVRLKQTTEWKARKVSAPPLRDCSLLPSSRRRRSTTLPNLQSLRITCKYSSKGFQRTEVIHYSEFVGNPRSAMGLRLPSRVHYVVQCTLSRKSSLSEKSERDFPTSEREKYFGVASGSICGVAYMKMHIQIQATMKVLTQVYTVAAII